MRAPLVAALLALTAATLAPAGAQTASPQPPLADERQESCPALGTALTQGIVTDDGKTRLYRVLFLVDGPTLKRAKEVANQAKASYAPLGIELRPSFTQVTMTGNGSDAAALLDEAQAMFRGFVPKGYDAVHVFTTKPISGWGLARCIEGVSTQRDAFSVSEEAKGQAPKVTGDTQMPWIWGDLTALVIAHELGHLMGGRHELSNCVQGAAEPDMPRPCTLMDTSLTMSPHFDSANAFVVRQLALRYLPRA